MQVERVRRLNEPREETPLCDPQECAACGFVIDGGGMSLGTRWLHLGCVEGYIESLERDRNQALAQYDALRLSVSGLGGTQGTIMWTGTGWTQVPPNVTLTPLTPTFDYTSAGRWTSSGSATSFTPYNFDLTISSTTSLEKSLGP